MGKHFLLSASSDKTIVLWDLRPSPPQIHYTLKGHVDPVSAMCLIGKLGLNGDVERHETKVGRAAHRKKEGIETKLTGERRASRKTTTFFSFPLITFLSLFLFITCYLGTDLISAAGSKLSAEPLEREDAPGSVLRMETYRLQQNKSNITALEVLPYHQLLVAGTEDGRVKLFR
jgi:WD40 repeat protein